MDSMFVNPNTRVPVTDGENTIYIREKMDFGTRAKYQGRLVRMAVPIGGQRKKKESESQQSEAPQRTMTLDYGESQLALLELNVVGWDGPAFQDDKGRLRRCNSENIRMLNPDIPLVDRALKEINERNKPPTPPADPDEAEGDEETEKNEFTSAGDQPS